MRPFVFSVCFSLLYSLTAVCQFPQGGSKFEYTGGAEPQYPQTSLPQTPNNTVPKPEMPRSQFGKVNDAEQRRLGIPSPLGEGHAPTQEEIQADLQRQRMGIYSESKNQQDLQEIYEDLRQLNHPPRKLSIVDSIAAGEQQRQALYHKAAEELLAMMEGKKPLDLKRAVFLSENPSQYGTLSYEAYCGQIEQLVKICRRTLQINKYDLKDNDAKNWAIQQLYIRPLKLSLDGSQIIQRPFTYDFVDFGARSDETKYFVSKLLSKGNGQCHSMPLLYAILAQELGTRAYIAYSPNHSYIVYPDKKGSPHNFETTTGGFIADKDIMNSGFVKTEAIQQGIYLRPTDLKETIANCLADLALSYQRNFGNDTFVFQLVDKVLKKYPTDMYALLIGTNFITATTLRMADGYGKPKKEELPKYPDLQYRVNLMHSMYDKIDGLGYGEMPEETYLRWLKFMETKKNQQEAQAFRNQIKTTVQ